MTREEHQAKLLDFFGCDVREKPEDLHEALYSMSETGSWPDGVDSVSEEQAMLCWAIVKKLREQPFLDDLRM
jgi:hypothetical protein